MQKTLFAQISTLNDQIRGLSDKRENNNNIYNIYFVKEEDIKILRIWYNENRGGLLEWKRVTPEQVSKIDSLMRTKIDYDEEKITWIEAFKIVILKVRNLSWYLGENPTGWRPTITWWLDKKKKLVAALALTTPTESNGKRHDL